MGTDYKLKLFIRFLKRNHIYNQFFANSTSVKGYHLRKINRRKENIIDFINDELNNDKGYIINRAFHWEGTEEGAHFWYQIYSKWDVLRRFAFNPFNINKTYEK